MLMQYRSGSGDSPYEILIKSLIKAMDSIVVQALYKDFDLHVNCEPFMQILDEIGTL